MVKRLGGLVLCVPLLFAPAACSSDAPGGGAAPPASATATAGTPSIPGTPSTTLGAAATTSATARDPQWDGGDG